MANITCHNVDKRLDLLINIKLQSRAMLSKTILLLQDLPCLSTNQLQAIYPNHIIIHCEDELTKEAKKQFTLATLVPNNNELEVIAIHTQSHSNSKAKALTIQLRFSQHNQKSFSLTNCYIRPRATHNETRLCLDWIKSTIATLEGSGRAIIMGDFNATNGAWQHMDSILTNTEMSHLHYRVLKEIRGRQTMGFMRAMKNLICLNSANKQPTFGNNCIDLAIFGEEAIKHWPSLELSQHQHLTQRLANNHHKILTLPWAARKNTSVKFILRTKIDHSLIQGNHFLHLNLWFEANTVGFHKLPRSRRLSLLDTLSQKLIESLLSTQVAVTKRTRRSTTLVKTATDHPIPKTLNWKLQKIRDLNTRLKRLGVSRPSLRKRLKLKQQRRIQQTLSMIKSQVIRSRIEGLPTDK